MKPTHFSRYLKFALFLAILCSFTTAYAYDFEVDGIYYNINGNEATVTYKGIDEYDWSSNEYSGNVIIPSTVTYNGSTYSVTSIGFAAFYACSNLTSITIPNSVTSIGGWAFTNCSGLANITIPNSITSIGSEAFYGTEWYNNQPNGIVYAGLVACDYKGTMPSGASIIIRDGTLGIAGSAFGNLIGLASITIPNSVTTIGEEAFSGCSGLTSITIPNSVTTIGDNAFFGCSGLTGVSIGNSVTNIGYRAFFMCESLTEIYSFALVPATVTSMTFSGCYGATLYVPYNALDNYKSAEYWKEFTNIVGIDYVPQANFFEVDGIYYNITSETNHTVEVTYKDNNYASYSGEVIIPSTITYNGTTYTVTAIGDSAFYNSNGVTDLTIPETVSFIGECAFYGCHPNTMTCLAMEPPTLNNSFDEWRMIRYDYWCTSDPMYILYVRPEAFNNYYRYDDLWSDWLNYFNFTLQTNGERTSAESISFDVYERFSMYDGRFLHAVIYVYGAFELYINQGGWVNYYEYISDNDGYGGIYIDGDMAAMGYNTYNVWAVQVEYGKLPSDEVEYTYTAPTYSPGAYYDTNYSPYDFIVDGISYRRLNNNSVAVAPDVDITTHHPVQYDGEDSECFCHGLYNGHITIPNTIEYDGNTYDVTSIDRYTFGNDGEYEYGWQKKESNQDLSSSSKYNEGDFAFYYGPVENRNLTSIILPNSITEINSCAFYNCSNLEQITIPNSVTNIGKNAFYGCDRIKYFHITGDGAWSGGALDVAVQRLDIASGITAIPGLKVNPREVYCYAKVPPTCDENTFTDYTGTLHVPESSLAVYFTAPYWCNFANIVGDAAELTDLTLNKDSAELLVDEQLTLNATIQPANANIDSITWESSNPSVATVTNDGVVTAKSLGECDIIVTCLDKRDTCHVKVVEQVTTITLDQHRASLLPNHILTLTPTVTPVPTDLVVTSSNPSVAAARLANGKVQVVGVSVGTAIIKVASADGNAVADSCFVNVYTEAGDVDGDGFVKIDDVTALIDHLLGSNSSIDVGNADINYDGVVSIADVTGLIDYLLGGGASMSTRETFTVNGVNFTMIRVPAGTFMMGATEEQGSDANSWEKPVHEVTLTSSYLIGETEVTQELWLAVMGTNPSKHEGSLQKPVENVSWLDCQEFISQLNALTGLTFRMPTEAEWEYAARGANRSRGYKYAGSNDIADVGNVSSSTTMPVGSLQPNELNIYDMSGNVDEWVWDLFGYYTSEPQIDPTGPADGGSDHMYRGGSWYSGANTARVSYRFFRASTFKRGTMGLRLAL